MVHTLHCGFIWCAGIFLLWLVLNKLTITVIKAVPISPSYNVGSSHPGANWHERPLPARTAYTLMAGAQEEHRPHRALTQRGFPGKPHCCKLVNWNANSFTSLHSHFGNKVLTCCINRFFQCWLTAFMCLLWAGPGGSRQSRLGNVPWVGGWWEGGQAGAGPGGCWVLVGRTLGICADDGAGGTHPVPSTALDSQAGLWVSGQVWGAAGGRVDLHYQSRV